MQAFQNNLAIDKNNFHLNKLPCCAKLFPMIVSRHNKFPFRGQASSDGRRRCLLYLSLIALILCFSFVSGIHRHEDHTIHKDCAFCVAARLLVDCSGGEMYPSFNVSTLLLLFICPAVLLYISPPFFSSPFYRGPPV
jgi:hypothetical protein